MIRRRNSTESWILSPTRAFSSRRRPSVARVSDEHKVPFRIGAYMLAIKQVAEVIQLRGVYAWLSGRPAAGGMRARAERARAPAG